MTRRDALAEAFWATLFHLYGAVAAAWQHRRRTT